MAVKKRQRKPVQLPADLSPKLQAQPLRKTCHHKTLEGIEDPCRCVDSEQDHDLPAAVFPCHAEGCPVCYRRTDLAPEQIHDPGAVDRRRHRQHCVENDRNRHNDQTDALSSHRFPQTADRRHRIGRHRKFYLVSETACFISTDDLMSGSLSSILLRQLPRLLSSVILRFPGIPGSFPSAPHVCQCRRSFPRPGR